MAFAQLGKSYFTYQVKKGDTLWSLSKRFKSSVLHLQLMNNLDGNAIQVGVVLRIANEGNFDIHVVTDEDKSLQQIGKKYDIPFRKIMSVNRKQEETIEVGECLLLPYVPSVTEALVASCNFRDSFLVDSHQVEVIITATREQEIITIILNGAIQVQDTGRHNAFASIIGEYTDFDGDGLEDIRLHYSDLSFFTIVYLFDPKEVKYKKIENSHDFPWPQKVANRAGLYFAYEAKGCADAQWESTLFTIQNFKMVPLAKIGVINCELPPKIDYWIMEEPDKKQLVSNEAFPFDGTYLATKFESIKAFWEEGYKKMK